MEFWGVEVKPGQTVKCEPGEDRFLHLSQSAIGESKGKGSENVTIYVNHNDQKLVIGTLSAEKFPQITYDLVFDKDFQLSHSSKNVSVYFCGYRSDQHQDEMDGEMFSGSDSEEEEDVPIAINANGKPKDKAQGGKPIAVKSTADKEDNAVVKAKAKSGGPIKAAPVKADDEDDEDDDDDYEGSDDDEDMMEGAAGSDEDDDSDDEDDSDDDDDESSEEEEVTPKKSAKGKRPAESASKTPVPEKKAKLVTPAGQKTGGEGKKNAHVATPHPAKQAGKTPANSGKAAKQSPKSAGSVNCESCSKTFNSDSAREAHTKAKHSGAK